LKINRADEKKHVSSAYLTFVAVDPAGNRVPVPQVIPETDEERRRYEGAARRREMRHAETDRRKTARQ
jgi:acyl-CoA hydrolase